MNGSVEQRARRRGGFLVLDAVIALSVVALLTMVIVTSAARGQRNIRVLSEKIAAMRIAERVLGGEPASSFADAGIEVVDLGDGWARVTVRYGQADAELIGREIAP